MRGAQPLRSLELAVRENAALRSGEAVIAAVSGGPDSAALAGLLAGAAADAGARVIVAHVNHGVRACALQDEGVALALASGLNLRAVVRALEPGPKSEAAMRDARYAALAEVARACGARRVFTAHHAQDQTESVLLALFRGTGFEGLAGMPAWRPLAGEVELERPLLRFAKVTLAMYAASRRLPFALDATNEDPSVRRNAVRAALRELRAVFPRLDEAVARYAEIAAAQAQGTGRAELRSLLREVIGKNADVRNITFERVDAAARAVERGHRGRVFIAPGVEIRVDGRVLDEEASKKESLASPDSPGGSH